METTKQKFGIKEIVIIGMFCALSYAVMALSKLIPVNIMGFLSFDFKDVVIAICGFIFGPIPAIIVSVIVSLIEMLTISSTGPIGFLMNVLSTCAFVCPAAIIYKARKRFSGALIGLVTGVLVMTGIMILWNWLITPIYMGMPREVVVGYLVPVFLPFNLIKGGMNAALTMLLYKPIVTALRKARLLPERAASAEGSKKGITIAVTLGAIVVLASLILIVLAWQEII